MRHSHAPNIECREGCPQWDKMQFIVRGVPGKGGRFGRVQGEYFINSEGVEVWARTPVEAIHGAFKGYEPRHSIKFEGHHYNRSTGRSKDVFDVDDATVAVEYEGGLVGDDLKPNGILLAFPGSGTARPLGEGEIPSRKRIVDMWRKHKLDRAWIGPLKGPAAGVTSAIMVALDEKHPWRTAPGRGGMMVQLDENEAWDILRALSEIGAAKPRTHAHTVMALDTILYATGLSARRP